MSGFQTINAKKIFAIHNERLLSAVQYWEKSLEERFRSSEKLFKSDNWKEKDDKDERYQVLKNINHFIAQFDWNNFSSAKIIPMLQGTSIETAWKIAQTGFTTVATLDSGWYGRGVYFTKDVNYAKIYSKQASKEGLCLILSLVVCGNVYPVTESKGSEHSLEGKPVVSAGYQSHYAVVRSDSGHICSTSDTKAVDELVVFQDGQAIPMFIIQC